MSTSTSEVVIETSLVSPVDTKQVRKALRYRTASVRTRTEWHDIVSFQFLGHFSVSPSFWTCYGTWFFFRTHVNATPLCTTFWNGPKWHGISYPGEQGISYPGEQGISYPGEQGISYPCEHGHMTILINTEINWLKKKRRNLSWILSINSQGLYWNYNYISSFFTTNHK